MTQAETARDQRSSNDPRRSRHQIIAQTGACRNARAKLVPPETVTQPCPTHVVIAEDDRDMRRFLVESFEEEGYRVTEAATGAELRRRLSGRLHGDAVPEILISDIRLPGFTGLELLSELRRSDWSLPVILITAFGDEAVHLEGDRLGAAMVLDKPFDVDDLINAVKAIVPA
jgi:DNA-binding response OmpR family regulator